MEIKKWIIELKEEDNGTITMTRTNDGFSALELLAICRIAENEILEAMKGIIKPDLIKRNVIIN